MLRSVPGLLRGAAQRGAQRAARPHLLTVREGSNRAKRGLFHERDVHFGNNISFAENKTRRSWKPNAHNKRLWSRILQCWLRFNVTTRALRAIDKAGGIDEYVLFTPEAKVDSIAGRNAKRMLLAKLEERGDHATLQEVALIGRSGRKMASIPSVMKYYYGRDTTGWPTKPQASSATKQ